MSNIVHISPYNSEDERLIGLVHIATKFLAEFGDMQIAIRLPDGTQVLEDLIRLEVMEHDDGERYFTIVVKRLP